MSKHRSYPAVDFVKTYIKTFMKQSIYLESAALTFVTLMGFVPFIMLTLLFIPDKILAGKDELIRRAFMSLFVPESANPIEGYINQLLSQSLSINIFNFILLFVTSYSLFRIINNALDRILYVPEFKVTNFFGQIVKFIGTILFGFMLILVVFSASSLPVFSTLFNIPGLQPLTVYVVPFMLLFLMMLLVYFFIPNVNVKARSLFIGAAVTSIAWIVVKLCYNWYILHLTNMVVMYGVLSSVPVFLFWIYINWVIVLGGAVLISMLDGRHEVNLSDGNKHSIRVTFEKEVGKKSLRPSKAALSEGELRAVLKEILGEDQDADNGH